jgi:hypothetical protein
MHGLDVNHDCLVAEVIASALVTIASAMALYAATKKSPARMGLERGKRARAGGQELSALVDRKHVLAPNQSAKFRPVACRLRQRAPDVAARRIA